jgi:hypothetical protein
VPPLVVPGFACYVARPIPDEGAGLYEGTLPGEWICDELVGDEGDGEELLRDARRADAARARAASSETVAVTTALGTVTLQAQAADRVLLRANAGESARVSAPEAGDASRCGKVRRARGTPRFEPVRDVRLAGGTARYDVRKPTRLCADDAGAQLLCYAARARGKSARTSELWVAHELGVEKRRVGRAKEICLPVTEE